MSSENRQLKRIEIQKDLNSVNKIEILLSLFSLKESTNFRTNLKSKQKSKEKLSFVPNIFH